MAKPGATQPDLVTDLSGMQKRLNDLERKPAPTSLYDTYPTMEWAAVGRGRVGSNLWSSCGIANVTGGKFDRVECKFITDRLVPLRSEAEIRLAAFKHSHTSHIRECVAATSTMRLTGNWGATATSSVLGMGKWRWIHGLPRGWDADSDDADSVYTIELQHRNPDDCAQTGDVTNDLQVFGFWKSETVPSPPGGGLTEVATDRWVPFLGPTNRPSAGWLTVPNSGGYRWDGSYSVSNMHYCVGMSEDQLPEATTSGYFWYSGGDVEIVRQADISEGYMNF